MKEREIPPLNQLPICAVHEHLATTDRSGYWLDARPGALEDNSARAVLSAGDNFSVQVSMLLRTGNDKVIAAVIPLPDGGDANQSSRRTFALSTDCLRSGTEYVGEVTEWFTSQGFLEPDETLGTNSPLHPFNCDQLQTRTVDFSDHKL